jgi:hypothetical protein
LRDYVGGCVGDHPLAGIVPGRPRRTPAVLALATVTQQPGDVTALAGSATPAERLRRVNLIERQRDQSESEAVSDARA